MTYAVIGKHLETGNIMVIGPFYHTARAEKAAVLLSAAEADIDFKWVDVRDGVSTVALARKRIKEKKRKERSHGKTKDPSDQ